MAQTWVTSAVFKGNAAVWVRYIYVGMYAWSYAWNHRWLLKVASCVGMFGVMGCGVSYELYHFPLCLTYHSTTAADIRHFLPGLFLDMIWGKICNPEMTPCMSATSCALCRVDTNSWLKHTSCWPCTDHPWLYWRLACTFSRKCMYFHHEFGTPSMSYIYTCVGMFRVMGCDVSFELYHFSTCLTYQQNGGGYRSPSVHWKLTVQ